MATYNRDRAKTLIRRVLDFEDYKDELEESEGSLNSAEKDKFARLEKSATDALDELLTVLPLELGIQTTNELLPLVFDARAIQAMYWMDMEEDGHAKSLRDEEEREHDAEALLQELEVPRETYTFVFIGGRAPVNFEEIELVNFESLSLRFISFRWNETIRFALGGVVSALSSGHAHRQVDSWARAVLGAAQASGILRGPRLANLSPVATTRTAVLKKHSSNDEHLMLDPELIAAFKEFDLASPADFSESELPAIHARSAKPALTERHLRFLRRILTSKSRRASIVRRACQFYGGALASQDLGRSAALQAISLEALFGAREANASAQALRQAVAAQQGGAEEEREYDKDLISFIYKKRSQYVHGGSPLRAGFNDLHKFRKAIKLVGLVLRSELVDSRAFE